MEISMIKKKKVRKHRGGADAFSPPFSRSKLDVGAMRRKDKAKAEQEFSDLVVIFENIKADLKENLAKGRFDYRKSLKKMYRLVWDWDAEGFLNDNQKAIARLRGVPLRPKANRFSGIVAVCCDRDRRTVSRWSQDLDKAFKADVAPQRLISSLEGEASAKAKKSKAKKPEAKKPEAKKPEAKKYRWGPKAAR
jgi:hypothetical protein